METRGDDFSGMDGAAARDYLVRLISTLKLTEKEGAGLREEREKWEGRAALARSRGAEALAAEAGAAAEKIRARESVLEGEIAELSGQIEELKRRLPGIAARERSIDPDLLEQELLIAAGGLPGAEEEAKTGRALEALEKEAAADAALAALKAKMNPTGEGAPGEGGS
jgi:phage shock protein A